VPSSGALLLASNHASHLEPPLVLATTPREVEFVTLADLNRVPVTGQIIRAYGVIWVRRDELDRTVIKQCLDALNQGKAVWVAPEGGRSPSGGLTHARPGVAWLAVRSGAPVVPVGIAGARDIVEGWKHFRRPSVTVAFGKPITFDISSDLDASDRRDRLAAHTETIMRQIAALLPPEYRGVYQ
jgi:1-acyl-sn-glycerol-3-phosphate acyltransferase